MVRTGSIAESGRLECCLYDLASEPGLHKFFVHLLATHFNPPPPPQLADKSPPFNLPLVFSRPP